MQTYAITGRQFVEEVFDLEVIAASREEALAKALEALKNDEVDWRDGDDFIGKALTSIDGEKIA